MEFQVVIESNVILRVQIRIRLKDFWLRPDSAQDQPEPVPILRLFVLLLSLFIHFFCASPLTSPTQKYTALSDSDLIKTSEFHNIKNKLKIAAKTEWKDIYVLHCFEIIHIFALNGRECYLISHIAFLEH